MNSSSGTHPKRKALSRRRSAEAKRQEPTEDPTGDPAGPAAVSLDGQAGPPDNAEPEGRPPETAEIYRSLLNELRRTFGGTIDDSNADAIAFAASELYDKDVEPRLWEQKSAQEILDSFGVPRAGAFTRYSLTDRLLLLKRTASPDRIEQAHALLTTLGAPETNESGSRLSLKERLEWLLVEVAPLPASDLSARSPSSASGSGPDQLVDALETIRQAVGSDDAVDGSAAAPPPPPADGPAVDLAGLGALIGGIQEELIRLRQAVESVQGALEETLQLLRAGDLGAGLGAGPSNAAPPPTVVAAPEPAAQPDAAEESQVPVDVVEVADPEAEAGLGDESSGTDALLQPEVAGPDDETQVVPVVPAIEAEEPPAAPPAGPRRRSLPKLLVIAVVLGLLVAGVAIALSAVGWSEMRDKLDIGWSGVLPDLVTYAAAPGAG